MIAHDRIDMVQDLLASRIATIGTAFDHRFQTWEAFYEKALHVFKSFAYIKKLCKLLYRFKTRMQGYLKPSVTKGSEAETACKEDVRTCHQCKGTKRTSTLIFLLKMCGCTQKKADKSQCVKTKKTKTS